jgi:hypothetical protein
MDADVGPQIGRSGGPHPMGSRKTSTPRKVIVMTTKSSKPADEAPKDADQQAEKTQREQVEESPVTIAERSLPQPVDQKDLPEQTAFQE